MPQDPPRIALFLRNLGNGGAERIMLSLAQGFAKQGQKVDMVLTKAEGTYLAQVPPEVRVVDLKASQFDNRKNFKFPTSLQSTSSLPKLVRYLRQERPLALLSATHYPNEIAVLAKHLARVPTRIVVSEHITLSVEARRVDQRSSRLAPLMARLFYPWADGIVAVSKGVAQDLALITRLPLERHPVIYNPVITPELIEKAKQPVEHPWFTDGEPPVVLGVGRLVEQKDFATLIRAFAEVRRVRPARLMILGDGKERSQLNTLVRELGLENDVALIGFVKNPYAYMARAAVFVLSSAWEGLPTVLIEAMAVGTPVVSTNCESGPEEILNNGKYGALVPVGDSKAIAQAILSVLAGNFKQVDPDWLDQFTWETSTQKYIDLLGIA
ncbi:MAG: glycosyltransferase [Cyanobacteriota bacterium]